MRSFVTKNVEHGLFVIYIYYIPSFIINIIIMSKIKARRHAHRYWYTKCLTSWENRDFFAGPTTLSL